MNSTGMVLGISSYTYGWSVGVNELSPPKPLTEMDLILRAQEFNLRCVQIGDNLALHKLSDSRLNLLNKTAQANFIRIEIGARELNANNLSYYVALARNFRAPLLRFIIDGDNYKPSSDAVIQIIKEVLPELTESNITLGIENHDRFRAKELAAIMEAIASDHVGICLDCVNSMGAGEGLEYVADVLARYTVNLHIKDFTIERVLHKMGFTITGVPAGTGMTNVPMLMEKLAPYNRCQSAVLEQWVPWQQDLSNTIEVENEWARQGVTYLKSLPFFKTEKT